MRHRSAAGCRLQQARNGILAPAFRNRRAAGCVRAHDIGFSFAGTAARRAIPFGKRTDAGADAFI